MTGAEPKSAAGRRTFVLVHGAWHGGWCWRRVADRLIAQGHAVFVPTLTGLGERSHLLGPDVNVDTHVTDVVNLMKWEGLTDVVLCGHSYGGMVISGVAEQMLPAISSMIFLDAFVPVDGDSMVSITGEANRALILAAVERGDLSVKPRSAADFHVNLADRAWVDAKCTPQPIGAMHQKLRLTGARDRVAKKAYIRAAGHESPYFDRYYEALRRDPAWRCEALPCGHDVMVDMPEELTALLLAFA